jgi:hypothetical protein
VLLLVTTSDKLRLVTSSAADIHVHASYVDYASGTITPGSAVTAITTAATTDIVAPPGASTQRNVKNLIIRNKHASTSNDVTLQFYNGTAYELFKCTLAAGEELVFNDGVGFEVFSATGALKMTTIGSTPIAARVYNDGDISISNGTWTILTFNSERFDTDAIHDTGSNTDRLTCKTAGKYQITGHVTFASNSTGLRYIALSANAAAGTGFIAPYTGAPALSGDVTSHSLTTLMDMVVGDYATLQVYQNSGGNLNVIYGPGYSPEFMMTRV